MAVASTSLNSGSCSGITFSEDEPKRCRAESFICSIMESMAARASASCALSAETASADLAARSAMSDASLAFSLASASFCAADEAVEGAVLRVVAEVGDDDGGKALDAGAHVGGMARYEHAVGGGERVHSDTAALSAHAMSDSADPGGTRIFAPLATAQMGWPASPQASGASLPSWRCWPA